MAHPNTQPPSIPAAVLAKADAELTSQEERRRQAREAAEKDRHFAEAVRAYCKATDAVWLAEFSSPFDPQPFLRPIHLSLREACKGLQATNRLAELEKVCHDRTYADFCQFNHRQMSRPSYEWAWELRDRGSKGDVLGGLVTETWHAESLRDALRWLRIFLCGLSGTGAKLPQQEVSAVPQPLSLAAEEAAVLVVLLRASPVRMKAEEMEDKIRLDVKTIRKAIQALRDRNLVEVPAQKKGIGLTSEGRAKATEMPLDAAASLMRPLGTGR